MAKIKWTTYLKIFFFLMIFILVAFNPKNILDIILSDIATSLFGGSFFGFLGKAISYIFHDKILLLLMGVLGIFLFFIKEEQKSIFILSTAFFGASLALLIKNVVQRPRPLEIFDGYSFPSGHSTVVALFFLSLLYIINKKDILRKITIFAMIAVPISRVIIGAHYVSDVVGGLLLGSIVVDLMKVFHVKLYEIYSNLRGLKRYEKKK